jgi:hypothetical protein
VELLWSTAMNKERSVRFTMSPSAWNTMGPNTMLTSGGKFGGAVATALFT